MSNNLWVTTERSMWPSPCIRSNISSSFWVPSLTVTLAVLIWSALPTSKIDHTITDNHHMWFSILCWICDYARWDILGISSLGYLKIKIINDWRIVAKIKKMLNKNAISTKTLVVIFFYGCNFFCIVYYFNHNHQFTVEYPITIHMVNSKNDSFSTIFLVLYQVYSVIQVNFEPKLLDFSDYHMTFYYAIST